MQIEQDHQLIKGQLLVIVCLLEKTSSREKIKKQAANLRSSVKSLNIEL